MGRRAAKWILVAGAGLLAVAGCATSAVSQGVGHVCVLGFGATGDGVTDDARAIQAALDAAQAGATVSFPPGTYVVGSPIRLTSSIRLTGAGPTVSTLRFSGTGGALLLGIDVHDIRITDLALVGTGLDAVAEENGGIALRVTQGDGEVAVNLTVERVAVSGFRSTGIAVTGSGRAVATGVTVRDCRFADLGLHGVLGYYVRDYRVEGCRLERIGRSGTIFPRCRDVVVRDCAVRTTGWHGIEVGDETEGFLITGNAIEDSGDHAGILVEQAAHRGIIAHNRVSRPRFGGIQLNNKPAQAAVREITVTSNLVDMGGNRTHAALLIYGDTTYTADDCIVEGNTFLGGRLGIEGHYLKRCRFDHNVVSGPRERGIDLVHLAVVGVCGNAVAGCPGEGIRVTPYAKVFTNSEVSIADNLIDAAPGTDVRVPAISIEALRGGLVRGNRVHGYAVGLTTAACDDLSVDPAATEPR